MHEEGNPFRGLKAVIPRPAQQLVLSGESFDEFGFAEHRDDYTLAGVEFRKQVSNFHARRIRAQVGQIRSKMMRGT